MIEADVEEEIRTYTRRLSEGDETLLDEADPTTGVQAVNGELLRAELRRAAAVSSPPAAAEAYDALGAERTSLVRQDLAGIKRLLDSDAIDADEAAHGVVAVVEFHGLRAVDTPPPTPQITEDDLGVVCWMAVLQPPK